MGERYTKTDESKKILYIDSNNLYGHSMSQPLPCDESKMWISHLDCYMNKLKETLNTPDDIDIGYFLENDLAYPENTQKTKKLPFAPENKKIVLVDFTPHMKK